MASCFAKQKRIKTVENISENVHVQEIVKSGFEKYYISDKFHQNNSYKKLFAPKNLITHKSSYISLNIDYNFENNSLRKILRIVLCVKNISSSIISSLSIETVPVKNVLGINPSKIFMVNLKPQELIHQYIFLAEFNPENYFIPVKISYKT